MALVNGTYTIRSGLGDKAYLVSPPFNILPLPLPLRPVLGNDPSDGYDSKWDVRPVGDSNSNLYTFKQAYGPLGVVDDTLWLTPGENPQEFSIESAGANAYRVKIPNEDRIWTLVNISEQVKVNPDIGLPGQRWTFTKIDALD